MSDEKEVLKIEEVWSLCPCVPVSLRGTGPELEFGRHGE